MKCKWTVIILIFISYVFITLVGCSNIEKKNEGNNYQVQYGSCEVDPFLNGLKIYSEEFFPYNYKLNGKFYGKSIYVIEHVLNKLGKAQLADKIQDIPWAESYEKTKTGSNSILTAAIKLKSRENHFKWACPLGTSVNNLYALKSKKIKIENASQVQKYTIGIVNNDSSEFLVRQLGNTIKVNSAAHNLLNLIKLKDNQIDLMVATKDYIKFYAEVVGYDPSEFEAVYVLDKSPVCIALSKDAPDCLINLLENAM